MFKRGLFSIFCILTLGVPLVGVSDQLQQIDDKAQQKGYVAKKTQVTPLFVEFDPNDRYSFIVYHKGDIVQYKGREYVATDRTDNNLPPPQDSRWELLPQKPAPVVSVSPQ